MVSALSAKFFRSLSNKCFCKCTRVTKYLSATITCVVCGGFEATVRQSAFCHILLQRHVFTLLCFRLQKAGQKYQVIIITLLWTVNHHLTFRLGIIHCPTELSPNQNLPSIHSFIHPLHVLVIAEDVAFTCHERPFCHPIS